MKKKELFFCFTKTPDGWLWECMEFVCSGLFYEGTRGHAKMCARAFAAKLDRKAVFK